MKKLSLLVLAVLALIIYSCMQDMPSEVPVGELKITSPSASDRFAIGDTVTIQAEAVMSKFSKMDFFVDGVLKGSDSDAPFTCEWLTAGVAVGLHEIKTVSYGAKGEISQSVKVELINGIAPDLNIYEPVDNSSYKIGSVINVLATATDSDGSVKSVAFYLNDSLLKYETAEPYNASWNTTGYTEGSYTLKAVAKDNMGVVSTKQISVNLYLKVPACVIETPANNSVYLLGQTVKIRAKATENLKNITSVKFYLDNNLVHTASTADSGSYYFYSWNAANVTTKNHQLKVSATDHNGRISTSIPVQVIINQVPTVDFISPQHNQMFSLGNTVQVSVNALDTDGTIDNVKIFVDGVEKGFITAPPYIYNWNTGGLAYGNHTLKAMATDDNGSVAEKEITVKLDHPALVNITSPAVASTHLAGSNITIAATTYDPDKKKIGKARSVTGVKFYVDNVLIAEDNSAPYQTVWNSTGAAAVEHFVKAEVTDNYGTVSDQGIMFKLHTAPTVTITAPANNAPITIGTIVEIKASSADSKKGKSRAVSKVEFFVDGVLKGTDNSAPYSYNWNTTGTTVGTHAIKTVVTDDFNVTAENQILVDLYAALTVQITDPADYSSFPAGSVVDIVATAIDNGKKSSKIKGGFFAEVIASMKSVSKVEFYIDDVLKSTDETAPYEYAWNTTWYGLGFHQVKAKVIDGDGAFVVDSVWVNINAPAISGMVLVDGGTFMMGSTTGASNEQPVHSVTLSSFYIGKYEVTQSEWENTMGTNPSWFSAYQTRPVEQVSWYDIMVYCNKLSIAESLAPCYTINGSTDPTVWGAVPTSSNVTWDAVICNLSAKGYRLPTEAEWEFAARGGNGSNGYTYSGSNTIGDVAWYCDNASSATHTVGTKAPNELGIYDMSGNVREWNWDWLGSYSSSAQNNPTGALLGSLRVFRGGSWCDNAGSGRVELRYGYSPVARIGNIGFRLVCPF